MASWTTPRTWTNGEVPTDSELNTHIRDNENFLYSPPACSIATSSSQTISDSTITVVNLGVENFDTDSMHSGSSSRITIVTAGKYQIRAYAQWAASATGVRTVGIFLNGGSGYTVWQRYSSIGAAPSGQTGHDIGYSASMTAGDYIEVGVIQGSGGDLNVDVAFEALFIAG